MTIRFPSGDWEYAATEHVPDVGDTLERNGKTWIVTAVTEAVENHRVVVMGLRPESLHFPPAG